MQSQKQVKKVSVVLVKSKQAESVSDINKMTVHLEKIFDESTSVDLKSRLTLTEANIKSADFIVFCGFSLSTLSSLFQALSVIEATDEPLKTPTVILYDEPGRSIYENLDKILMSGMDMRRVDPKVFKKVIDTWRHHDIISMVNQLVRVRESEQLAELDGSAEPNQAES
jgi:hypothetical protein